MVLQRRREVLVAAEVSFSFAGRARVPLAPPQKYPARVCSRERRECRERRKTDSSG